MNVVITDPRVTKRLAELGGAPMPMTPADFGKPVAVDTAKWAKVAQLASSQGERAK